MKKKWAVSSIVAVSLVSLSCVSFAANSPSNQLEGTKTQKEAMQLQQNIYSATPFVADPDKKIQMKSAASEEEAKALNEKIYAETPFIKQASPGTGVDNTQYGTQAAVPLPYYFDFDFDSNLTSVAINHPNAGTVRITANADWDQKPNQYDGTIYDYYDVTLWAGGKAQGTFRFDTGSWQHADWTNVPADSGMYFTMSKHPATWSGAPGPGYDGDISGSGEVL